jgi:hypothetical protein
VCLCRAQPTNLYSDGTGLRPNDSHHLIEPTATEFRCAAIFTLELRFVELAEVRNETWDKHYRIVLSVRLLSTINYEEVTQNGTSYLLM